MIENKLNFIHILCCLYIETPDPSLIIVFEDLLINLFNIIIDLYLLFDLDAYEEIGMVL